MILGDTKGLHFDVTLGAHDQALGLGSLRAAIGKSFVWTDQEGRGISWTWIDLLEQLAQSWPFLKYEESTPLSASESVTAFLRSGRVASPIYGLEPTVESTKEDYIFLRRHNLSSGIEGLYLPNLSILREGRKIWVVSSIREGLFDFSITINTLSQLGDLLATHISSGQQDGRSRRAIEMWHSREPDTEAILHITLGSDRLVTDLVPAGQTLASYFEVRGTGQNEDEYESSLLIAARMSEAVPLKYQRAILEQLRACPAGTVSTLLREVSAEAIAIVPEYYTRPHKQGESLAQWARKKFGLALKAPAEPKEVLHRLGVSVKNVNFGIESIDAIGCWGQRHGPTVLVNVDGKHAHSIHGRRATLAHELAHVLVDRNGGFPAAEVLGGNVPKHLEQRASAFAAEFLFPKEVLMDGLRKSKNKVDTIKQLQTQYSVSRELAAWQIYNSRAYAELDDDTKMFLNGWMPRNDSFFSNYY
jgi:Zn-dependent peptidase ImmA (M78 family)